MPVKPDGPLSARIAFCGEAPGLTEEMTGQGFTGMSGKVLWETAGRYSIVRSDCYVTNVIKERPPGDDLSKFIVFRQGTAKTTAAYDAYEKQLYAELEQLTACNVIVAVGAVALYALTRKVGITKWRGSILSGPNGRKIIPIIHPAAALREYSFMNMISLDMARVSVEAAYPDLRLPARSISLGPTFSETMQYLQKVKEARKTAVDIEVMRDEVSCISFSVNPSEGISIPFISHGADYFTLEQEVEIWRQIADILEDEEIVKIGQNLVFDSTFLYNRYHIITR